MGLIIIDQVISALQIAGIKAQRAYPGRMIPTLTQVVAAVQIEEADFTTQKIVLDVKILGPQKLGAEACEDTAIMAAQVLENNGFSCTVGAVSFDGSTGFYCVSCVASKQSQIFANIPFRIGTIPQNWVVSFTAKRQTDEGFTSLRSAPWKVRLEQFFPDNATEDGDPDEDQFHLSYGPETYTNCVWTSHTRQIEAGGIRQIREGIAEGRLI